MNTPAILIGAVILTGLVIWMATENQSGKPASMNFQAGPAEVTQVRLARSEMASQAPTPALADEHPVHDWFNPPASAVPSTHLNNAAITSLRQSRESDPRAPAIGQSHDRIAPDTATLESPALYQNWQQANREARYASYLLAADQRLQEMDQQLAWGRDNGVSDYSLKEGEEKRQKLQTARDRLASDYPHLVKTPTHSPEWEPPTRAVE